VIFPFGEVVLKSYDFSVILFALNCRRQYNYAKHNITAKQYNSPLANKTGQVSLRTLGQSLGF